jgi:hypothetical protein
MKAIDLTIAKQMVERYESTRKKLIDGTYNINDTKSIWFDVAAFKDFVNNLPAETTGVRVYLGAYDETVSEAPSQTTAIFIGTVNNGSGDTDALLDDSVLSAGLEAVNVGKACPPDCPPPY